MNIIPFESYVPTTSGAANELAKKFLGINSDVATTAAFPTLSIKGKVFAIVKDGQRKALTRPDPEDPSEQVPVQSISLTVLRANMKARVYYEEEYQEEASERAKPTCYSHDGIAPAPDAASPQSTKCQMCKHAVWGSKTGDTENGKGTACASNARLAIAAPDKPNEALLLRVPPGSIKAFREAVKVAEQRQLPYNQIVMRIGFDKEAPSPKLTFKPVGILDDATYAKAAAMYDDEVVHQIVGVQSAAAAIPAPAKPKEDPADELEAAIAAKEALERAKKPEVDEEEIAAALAAKAAAEAEAKKKAAAEAKAKREAEARAKKEAEAKAKAELEAKARAAREADIEEKPASTGDDLLDGLNSLLGGLDD